MAKVKIEGKRIKHLGKVDIRPWVVNAAENFSLRFGREFKAAVLEAANEVLTYAVDYGVMAFFYGMDNRKPPKSLMIEVTLPLGEDEASGPTWRFSLEETVDLLIASVDDYPEMTSAIHDMMRALVQKLDDALTSRKAA
jgi:hypothetical protein